MSLTVAKQKVSNKKKATKVEPQAKDIEITTVELATLKRTERALKSYSDADVQKHINHFHHFGMIEPLRVWCGKVIDGEAWQAAAEQLNLKRVPVIDLSDMTETDARAYAIAIKRLSELGKWDWHTVLSEWDWLEDQKFADLSATAFDDLEQDRIRATYGDADVPEDDAIPAPQEIAVTQSGDVWALGDHRLMCGDSTDADAVSKLMNGKTANLLFTSPPYNAGDKKFDVSKNKKSKGKYEKYDDDVSQDQWASLVDATLKTWRPYSLYQFYNIQQLAGNKRALWQWIGEQCDHLADIAIWSKGDTAPAYPKNVMNSSFEFVFMFSQKKNPSRAINTANFRGTVSNVFVQPRDELNENAAVHAATFPVSFPHHFINKFTAINALIADNFMGCGTTMIAAEHANRICYGMELDPIYVDVAVRRWQNMTGKVAVHAETGEPFPADMQDIDDAKVATG